MTIRNFPILTNTSDLNLYHAHNRTLSFTDLHAVKELMTIIELAHTHDYVLPIGYRVQYLVDPVQGLTFTLVKDSLETVVHIVVLNRLCNYLEWLLQTNNETVNIAVIEYPRIYFNATRYRTFLQALEQEQ